MAAKPTKHQKEVIDLLKKQADEIKTLKEDIAPMIEIYRSFTGFGSIAKGFLKWVVVPMSIIMGIILAFKNLSR